MKGLDERLAQEMIELSREGKCADCGKELRGAGQLASVPGYPPNLQFCGGCLESLEEAVGKALFRTQSQ